MHSEFEVSKMDDDCRREQILQEAILKKDHPQSNFNWGNKKSLIEDPREIGKSAFEMLHEWFPRNYSSKFMKLALQKGLKSLNSRVFFIFKPEKEPSFTR